MNYATVELFFDADLEIHAPEIHKRCSRCCTAQSYANFHRRRDRDLATGFCKDCANKATRKWYADNREYALDGMRRYLRDMPMPLKSERAHFRNVCYKYGITPEIYNDILKSQGGVCAICKMPEVRRKAARLSVDHSHTTGEVRGLLCNLCNSAIGKFKERIDLLESAINYLRRYA